MSGGLGSWTRSDLPGIGPFAAPLWELFNRFRIFVILTKYTIVVGLLINLVTVGVNPSSASCMTKLNTLCRYRAHPGAPTNCRWYLRTTFAQ